MFKRRKPRSYSQIATEFVYPRGGFRRSATYLWHRLRRLPDPPQRIARGIALGVFFSFSPLHGFHFIVAALVCLLIRGNILAAFVGTLMGNPLTMPFIALGSVGLGRKLLDLPGEMTPQFIFREFAQATAAVWNNVLSVVGPGPVRWDGLTGFYHEIFLPYAAGGMALGGIAAVISYYVTIPIVRQYHQHKARKMEERIARVRARGPIMTTAPDLPPPAVLRQLPSDSGSSHPADAADDPKGSA